MYLIPQFHAATKFFQSLCAAWKTEHKQKGGQRFIRAQALKKLIEHCGGVAKFCRHYGINQRTLNVWREEGVPNRFLADCLNVAAQNPPLFDVLLDQARGNESADMGIAANG